MFANFKEQNLNQKRKKDMEELLVNLLESPEESVWDTAIDAIYGYHKLSKEDEFIREELTKYAKELNEKGDQTPDFEKYVKIFVNITDLNISKLNIFIEGLLFNNSMLPWQLEVVANTAPIFGSKMYQKGALKEGLTYFSDQYMKQYSSPEKGEMMLYTIKQLVESLTEEHQGRFAGQVIGFVRAYQDDKDKNVALGLMGLEVLSEFYEFNCQNDIEYLSNLLENIVPLISDDSPYAEKIFSAVGKFFKVTLF